MRPKDLFQFNDRPGTRLRIVLPQSDAQPVSAVKIFFGWSFKLVYAVVAAIFCVAVSSYVPLCGPAIAPFVPADCAAFVHVANGAELHRELSASAAFNALLDDPDTADFLQSFLRSEKVAHENAGGNASDPGAGTLRALIISALGKWHLTEEGGADFYPFVGGEIAATFEAPDKTAQKALPRILFFSRVSGGRGALLRMLALFFKSKHVEIFDLGGGLMAAGFNGARPAFGAHPLAPLAEHPAAKSKSPLAWIALDARGLSRPQEVDAVAQRLKDELQHEDSALAHMSDAGVPEYILQALLKPPDIADMLNLHELPQLVRLELFAGSVASGGGIRGQGSIQGEMPKLPAGLPQKNADGNAHEKIHAEKSTPAEPIAECVLPVDLRALFIRHVAGSMKLVHLPGLTRTQRRWIARFRTLEADGADPEKDLWPALGHVMQLSVFEPKKDAPGTALGTARAWLSFEPKNTEDAFFCATDLARVRWDFLFDENEKATAKPPYVRRFHRGAQSANSAQELFVLATGQINAPAWSIGAQGFRLTSEAGVFALRDGPAESDLPAPPERLDSYGIKLNGARLAPTAEALATVLYDDLEEELGNAQKFGALYPHRDLHIRIARKWARLLGRFEFAMTPREHGADLELKWHPGSLEGSDSERASKEISRDLKGKRKLEPEKTDDDAPPPLPPPQAN